MHPTVPDGGRSTELLMMSIKRMVTISTSTVSTADDDKTFAAVHRAINIQFNNINNANREDAAALKRPR